MRRRQQTQEPWDAERALTLYARHIRVNVETAQAYLDRMKAFCPDDWAERTRFKPFLPPVAPEPPPKKKRKYTRKPLPKEIRQLVLERDGHKCFFCKSKKRLHIHHLKTWKEGGTGDPENLLVVCKPCHTRLHEGQPVHRLMMAAAH